MVLSGLGQAAADVMVEIRADNSQYNKALDKTESRTQSFARNLKKYGGMAAAAFGGAAAGAMAYSVKAAAAHQQVETGFSQMVEKQGKDVDKYLEKLQEASEGTMSEAEIMRQANQALLLGLDLDAIESSMESVSTIALNTGQDVGYLYESLVQGVGRMSSEMLDNLGVTLKAQEAYDEYAKRIDESADALSDTEKRTAFQTIAMERLEEKASQFGGVPDTAQTSYQQLHANLQDAAVTIGEDFLPAAESLADWAKDMSEAGHIKSISKALVTLGYSLKSSAQMAIFFASTMRLDRAFKDHEGYVNDTKAALDAWTESGKNYRETMQEMSNDTDSQSDSIRTANDVLHDFWRKQMDAGDEIASTTDAIEEQSDSLSKLEKAWLKAGNYISGSGEFVSRRDLGLEPRKPSSSGGNRNRSSGGNRNRSSGGDGKSLDERYPNIPVNPDFGFGPGNGKGVDPGNSRPKVESNNITINTGDINNQGDLNNVSRKMTDAIRKAKRVSN